MFGTLSGKSALVTGAGMGIGRAIALAFAREEVGVVVADVNTAAGEETVRLIQETGGKAVFAQCNVSAKEDVKMMVETAVSQFGRLDYAINNAGIHTTAPVPFTELDDTLWDRLMNVNLKGVFLCMQEELRQMEKQSGGAIVNVASLAGIFVDPVDTIYTASKHGVMGLTKAAAFEYVKKGVRINAVCPAPVNTPMLQSAPQEVQQLLVTMLPMGRPATPDEIVGAVMYLCSDAASYVTGTGLIIDGGVSLV